MSNEVSSDSGESVLLSIMHDGVELGKCGASGFELKERPLGKPLYKMGSNSSILFPSTKEQITAKARAILIPYGKQVRFLMEMDRFSWEDVVFRFEQNNIDFCLQQHGSSIRSNDDVIITECLFYGVRNEAN